MKKLLLGALTLAAALAAPPSLSAASSDTPSPLTLTSENITPEEFSGTGWYKIYNNICAGCAGYQGGQVYNREDEYNQNNSNSYALGITQGGVKPGAGYIYIEYNGSVYHVKSPNGHWINQNCTSTISTPNATAFTKQTDNTYAIGGCWSSYIPNANAQRPDSIVGQSGTHTGNRWTLNRVHPEEEYDLWTVSILNGVKTGLTCTHTQVTCNSEANQGLTKVFDGGTLFITKGAQLSVADFEAPIVNEITPRISVDADTKTIVVEYPEEELYNLYVVAVTASVNATNFLSESDDLTFPAYDASKTLAENKTAAYDYGFSVIKNKLNGKKVQIRCFTASGNTTHGYMRSNGTAFQHVNEDGANGSWDLQTVWTMGFTNDNRVTLYNEVHKHYASNSAPNSVGDLNDFIVSNDSFGFYMTMYVEGTEKNRPGYFSFNTNGSTINERVYAHAKASPTIGKWGNGGDGSWWFITLLSDEEEQGWVDAVAQPLGLGKTPLGVQPGQFTVSGATAEEVTAWREKYAAMTSGEKLDYSILYELATALTTGSTHTASTIPAPVHTLTPREITYTHNGVERGSVIRIKNFQKTNYFGVGETGTVYNIGVNGDLTNSAFYYTPQGHLVSVDKGVAVKVEGGYKYTQITTAAENEGTFGANILAPVFLHKLYSSNNETFMLTYQNQNSGKSTESGILAFSNGAIGYGSAVVSETSQPSNLADNTWGVFVEYVTELPVKIHTDGKGTIVAPVALKAVNDDYFKTYIAGMDTEGNLVFTATVDDETIPAGSHVVISTKDGHQATTVNIPVDYSGIAALTDDATAESRFVGSHLVKNITEKPGHVLYVKSETKESDNTDLTAKANDVVFEQAGTTIPAGALAFYAENTTKEGQELPEVIALNLENPHNGTTGIVEVNAEENAAAVGAIYDLQGRRLNKAVKGLNIINGKKVIVK